MDSSQSGPSAETLLAEWIVRRDNGDDTDIEALYARHPDLDLELRELHRYWERTDRALRAQRPGGSLAERLHSRYGSDVDPEVSLEPESKGTSDFSSEVLDRLRDRTPASTRYRMQGEIARGGMGAVLRIWDEDLRRHLAMKVMLGKGAPAKTDDTPPVDPVMLARFLEEAQVTGQLDHPGIVPVHELGLDPEGRVFFTMKLVKGQTLGEVFDELAKGEGGWTQTRVLGLLLKVCEAMSYAHAKGVIHRDLKPANVMVGRFGEVYVMDWGLAKILGRDDEKDLRVRPESELLTSNFRTERRDHAGDTPDSPLYTMDGDVVGTPAYMSPEQAAGKVSEMGPPSDVYGLGAMLYHLIAGHMPYVPPDARLNNLAVWSSVQGGPPRPLGDGAPAELVALCEKAMARSVTDRYHDMAALADDLSAYIEGRVVRAYETGAWADARKWVSRNTPLAASLAAVLLVTVGGLGAVGYVQAEGLAAEKEQRERADLKTAEAEQNLLLAQRNEAEAQQQRELADENAADANQQRERAEDAEQQALAEAERATLAEAEALDRARELEQVASFQAEQLRELDVRLMGERLRAALLDAAPEERRERLTEDLEGLNFTSLALGSLEQNLFGRTIDAIDAQFAAQPLLQARLLQWIAVTLQRLGLLEMAADPHERALAILRAQLGDEHPDTLVSVNNVGALLWAQGRPAEAEPYYREALEGNRRMRGDTHPDTLISINNMGMLLHVQGRLEEAEPFYREALEGRRRVLGDEHPHTLYSITSVGSLLRAQGKLEEADACYRDALEIRRRVLGADHLDTLNSVNNMGTLLQARGKLAESEPYFLEALETRRRVLGDEHPDTLTSIGNLGGLLLAQGKLTEGETYLREALESRRRVLGDDHPDTLLSINNLGGLLRTQGRLTEAEPYHREAHAGLLRVLGDRHPDTLSSTINMGSLLRAQGRLAEAAPYYREALEGRRQVLGPAHPETLRTIAATRRVLRSLVESAREADAGSELAGALAELGIFELMGASYPQAEEALGEALDLFSVLLPETDPRRWQVQSALGAAIAGAGRRDEAEYALLESAEWLVANGPRPELGEPNLAAEAVQRVIDLYDSWHAAAPGQGRETQADRWRARLEELKSRQSDR